MSMDYYLPRDQQKKLREKLDQVPGLVEELSVTITRQARIIRPGLGRLKHQKPGSRLPFHLAAAAASTELNNCLEGWVRFTCRNRQIRYTGPRNMLSHANWLKRNIIGLSLIEGSETAYEDIAGRIEDCRLIIDLPPDDEIHIDRDRVRQANRQVLTAGQVEKIAGKLGALGTGLNKRRVETLNKGGELHPCAIDDGVKFYRLGDVLDAHHRNARRNRKIAGRG